MRKLPLSVCFRRTSNQKYALVDDNDFDWLNRWKWSFGGNYAMHKPKGKKNSWYMHRIIMNANPGEEIDHVDGNGLNNQRSNLRRCTHPQNLWNRKLNHSTKSKGVGYSKQTNQWRSVIQKDGHKIHLGYFKTKKEAQASYDTAARLLFGEFARMNGRLKRVDKIELAKYRHSLKSRQLHYT